MDPPQSPDMDRKEDKKHFKKLSAMSHSLEIGGGDGRRLRKQAVVGSMSSDSISSIAGNETMPKICLMSSMNKSVQQLMKEEHDLKPGHRPPTPARQSLPNLLPAGGKQNDRNSKTELWKGPNSEIRRITLGAPPRSASPTFLTKNSSSEIDLNASTRSEGWGTGAGGVVHLPPISSNRGGELRNENRLTVAKKTLEQLDTVLSTDDSLVHLHAHHARPSAVHTHS